MTWRPHPAQEIRQPPPSSGVPVVDAYLDTAFESIPGWSSKFSASIVAGLMDWQTGNGIEGHLVEIGVFEGRFILALARALRGDEKAFAIDTFEWPEPSVEDRFRRHLEDQGLTADLVRTIKADSRALSPSDLSSRLHPYRCRVIHIDGDHAAESVTSDLKLSDAIVDDRGLIVLDDMFHPCYPRLTVAVFAFLDANPDWKVLCAIDRTSLVSSAKYVLCRSRWLTFYRAALQQRFKRHIWPGDVAMDGYTSLILSCDQSYLASAMYLGVTRRSLSRSK